VHGGEVGLSGFLLKIMGCLDLKRRPTSHTSPPCVDGERSARLCEPGEGENTSAQYLAINAIVERYWDEPRGSQDHSFTSLPRNSTPISAVTGTFFPLYSVTPRRNCTRHNTGSFAFCTALTTFASLVAV